MKSSRFLPFLIFLFFLSEGLQGQKVEEEPESPEFLFPAMVLEAEVREDRLPFTLPPFIEPQLEFPTLLLETTEDLNLPPAFISLPLEGSGSTSQLSRKTSLYTEGILGLGTRASLLGDLALYQTGEDTLIDLRFSYQSKDGYQFKDPGTGFFDRKVQMQGGVRGKIGKKAEARMEVSIEEKEVGLQQVSPSYSNLYRFVDGNTLFSYPFGDAFTFFTQAQLRFADRLLTGTDPENQSETTAKALAGIGFDWEGGTLRLEATYRGGTYSELSKTWYSTASGKFQADWQIVSWLSFMGHLGVWGAQELEVPWGVDVAIKPSEEIIFSFGGEYSLETLTYRELWSTVGPLLQQDSPLHRKKLSVGGGMEWKGRDSRSSLFFRGNWEKRYREPLLAIYDTVEEGFPFYTTTLESLRLRVGASYGLLTNLQVSIAGSWLGKDRGLGERPLSLEGALRYNPIHSPFGANLTGHWQPGKGNELPLVTLEGFYRLRENVEVSLSLEDVLAPWLKEGRIITEPFLEPGFQVIVKAKVYF